MLITLHEILEKSNKKRTKILLGNQSSRFKNENHFEVFPAHCSKSSFFVQKINFDFPEKIVNFFGRKTRENIVVWDFLAVDNFDFTRKIVKKILSEKLVKMLGFCQN